MDAKAFSSTIARFAAKFCNELEKKTSVVSSPLSAEFVLALLTLGTTGPAHSELLTALGIPNDDAVYSLIIHVGVIKLKAIKGVTLNVANRVYVKDGPYELEPQIEEDAVKVFDAGIEKVDFNNNVAAANLINKWVESKTNNKIKDVVSADSLDEDTRLVLVNALYFKGAWKDKFDKRNTTERPFFVSPDTTVPVPMMYMMSDFRFGRSEALQAQFLELPYLGDEASMVVVLPFKVDGLDDVLQKLVDRYDLLGDLNKMYSMGLQVGIPKFKIETEIDLSDLLPKLGIKSIFDPKSSGLDKLLKKKETLYVSKAVQKAFIEVNEEGAEAAAATCMVMKYYSAPDRFTADRPFLYLLVDSDRNTLFVGVYRGKD